MLEIYESFLWWLSLWLPEDSRFMWLLDEATHDEISDEFWEAIAPELPSSTPWDIGSHVRSISAHLSAKSLARTNPVAAFNQFVEHDF